MPRKFFAYLTYADVAAKDYNKYEEKVGFVLLISIVMLSHFLLVTN